MPAAETEDPMDGAGEPRSELLELQFKANQKTDETLESTRIMLSLCEDAKEAGIQTLVTLDDQGDQLDRVEDGLDQIMEGMKEAEKNLSGMDKCCGLCVLPWNKSSQFQEDESTRKSKDEVMVTAQPTRVMDDRNGLATTGGYIGSITNDAREGEMEENMTQVNNMIGNLRNMAVDMGSEMNTQNAQLSRMNVKTESNAVRIKLANERAVFILKKA